MEEKSLIWHEEESKPVFNCRVFSVREIKSRSPLNKLQTYTVIDATDWAITVPVLETEQGKKFVMVKQWRHGAGQLSLEFPGGVFNPMENAEQAAARELREETGYTPGKIQKIGEFCPNPAIMSNHVHFFLAENLTGLGKQELDEDEYVETVIMDIDEVIKKMGQPPFIHALMGTALSLYYRRL